MKIARGGVPLTCCPMPWQLHPLSVPIGASRIKGRTNAYRIRVVAHRIVYEVHVTEIVVYVVRVGHRREVYRRILRRG